MSEEFFVRNVLNGKTVGIVVSDGIITEIDDDCPTSAESYICPGGVIDTQVNGYIGYDYSENNFQPEDALKISEALVRKGTFQHFATIVTRPQKQIVENIDKIVCAVEKYPLVARCITGIHVEGNYISRVDGPRGAHDLSSVRPASIEEFDQWFEHSKGLLKYITIGAEVEGCCELIRNAVSKGVLVSLGHTGANKEQIDLAVKAGATGSTHLGNGVFAKLDRFDNPIWPQLRNPKLCAGIIADGCHVNPDLVWIISRCKDSDHLILVSDLSQCAGLPLGRRMWGNMLVDVVEDGSVRLADTPFLAGAGSQLLKDVWNYSRFTGTDYSSSFKLCTYNPTNRYGLDQDRMSLSKGSKASFVIFNDTDSGFDIIKVYENGKEVL